MGRNGQKKLDQLIDQVARGERDLASISDQKLREAVRVALRLHQDAPVAPDAYARKRMRARVMAGLEPRRPTLLDNAWTALELLARPAPYIVRGVAAGSVAVCLGMGTIVASADTLPDDLLYPLKLATEQVRLALADAPGDRASVELSIAGHRLSEAEQLAGSGRTSDALVASALYSQHIATAAAEIAAQNDPTDLGSQLQVAFNAQRDRAQSLAVTLSADVKSARGAQILALIASPSMAPGQTKIEQVALTAASVAQQLAVAADQAAADNALLAAPPAGGSEQASPAARAVVPESTAPSSSTPSSSPTAAATATVIPSATASAAGSAGASPSAPASASASAGTSAAPASVAPTGSASSAPSPSAASTPPASPTTATPTTTANNTTSTNTTNRKTTTTTTASSPPTSAPTHDPRANDAAKATRDAADKAKAATDRLREALKERENKHKGR